MKQFVHSKLQLHELRDFKNPKKDSKLQLLAYGKENDGKGRLIINKITKDNRRTFW